MNYLFFILSILLGLAVPASASASNWSASDLQVLRVWIAAAPHEGLPRLKTDALDKAQASGNPETIAAAADMLALRLAKLHLLGAAAPSQRRGWNIADTDRDIDLDPALKRAVENGSLASFFSGLRPAHPDYEQLRLALLEESDAARRATISLNMERWRWMPRKLGKEFLIVNAPAFEARLWRNGLEAGTWRVIVGKKSTPTPVFAARVTGVNLNPWWYVPDSIVRESIGALVRRNPSTAKARGYVWSDGVYRQKPGPNNALGEMKLVMPNNFRVYLHDTPNKALFNEEVRAYSHGCVRVGNALDLAATLLAGVVTRGEIDAVVQTRKTTTFDLSNDIPIYLTYFTAFPDKSGSVQVVPDIYKRD